MTHRLYYHDSYLTEFRARVVEIGDAGRAVYLDRSAFYPASGGQPADRGTLNGIEVIDVADEGERVRHVLAAPLAGEEVEAKVDSARRFDHMQQHTGQHLLSAVLESLYGMKTVSFHMGEESSTIELAAPALSPGQMRTAERRANELIWEDRPVSVAFEHSSEAEGLRKASEREGELRIISIQDCDRSACGGTHVRSTGAIGVILLRKTEKLRGNVRLEFLCGGRAVARARADYESLTQVARVFSSQLDETPALVAAQAEQLREADKARRKLAVEKAEEAGRALWRATEPLASGRRLAVEKVAATPTGDEIRARANGFIAEGDSVYLAVCDDPPSLLFAASVLHAGNEVKTAVTAQGGRGGGSPRQAQGSVPTREALQAAVASLTAVARA